MKFSTKKLPDAEDKVSPFLKSSPIDDDDGEQRLGTNIKLKDLTSQSDKAVEKQLKANMHLLSSSLVVAKLKQLKNMDRPVTWLKEL